MTRIRQTVLYGSFKPAITHDARLSRSLLTSGLVVLVGLSLFVEALSWYMAYRVKLDYITQIGGPIKYVSFWIRNSLLSEVVTVLILTQIIYLVHRWFDIKPDEIGRSSLVRYELSFLPVMLIAFPIFNPFTQSLRYLLLEFRNYSVTRYWDQYIAGTYSWQLYFIYLFPVLIIGYGALNLTFLWYRLRQD